MALCGKNLSLDAVTDKIAEIESKITEKIDAVSYTHLTLPTSG